MCLSVEAVLAMKPFLHERLTRSLILEIASGLYAEGAPFLSFRQIIKGWKVSRTTTNISLESLIECAVLQRRDRSRFVLSKGAVNRARLLVESLPGPELSPPTAWVNRARKLVAGVSAGPVTVAVVADSPFNVEQVMEEQLIEDYGYSVEVVDGHWQFVTFLREMNTRPSHCTFHFEDGSAGRQEQIIEALRAERPHGVVIFRRSLSHSRTPLLRALKKAGIPTLTVLNDCEGQADASLDFNHVAAGRAMMKALVEHGHRHIAVFNQATQGPRFQDLCEGALSYAREWRGEGVVTAVPHIFASLADMKECVRRCFSHRERPTAAIFTAMYNCIVSYPLLRQMGLRVPTDVSLISRGSPMYSIVRNGFLWIDLMDQDLGRIGIEAARLIMKMVEGIPVPHANLLEMPHLKGKSIRRVRPVVSKRSGSNGSGR